jgi:hypothetical protein
LYLLNRAGRFADCVAEGERVLSSEPRSDGFEKKLAGVHAELAAASWRLRRDRDLALAHAWKAIGLDTRQPTAAWVVRDVAHALSPTSRLMRVMIRGRWSVPVEGETEPPGFFATYDVVADTADEALAFIRPFEPEGVRDTLAVEECTPGEAVPDEPKGVYEARGGHTFFPWPRTKPWWKLW